MSLLFGGASSDTAKLDSPAGLTVIPPQFSFWCWAYVTALVTQKSFFGLAGSVSGSYLFRTTGTAGDLQCAQIGSTNESLVTTNTPLATLNKRYFLGVSYDFGTGIHVYVGDAQTLCAEATYGSVTHGVAQTALAGTVTLSIANNRAANAAPNASIGKCGLYTSVLTQAQFQYIQRQWSYGFQLSNAVGLYLPGYETGSTVTDHSSQGNNLAITGATRDTAADYWPGTGILRA